MTDDNIKLIQNLIEESRNLPYADEVKLDALIRRAQMVIRVLFGEESIYLKHLVDIRFFRNVVPYGESKYTAQSWNLGQGRMLNLFNTMLEEAELSTKTEARSKTSSGEKMSKKDVKNSNRVFVVHGRNEQLKGSIFRFLRALGLDPIEWPKAIELTGKPSSYISEIIDAGMNHAQATLVLLSGDDEAKLKEEYWKENDPEYEKQLMPQARPNVLFEAGMAMAKEPDRTILVQVGNLRKWTDVEGRHITYLNNTADKRHELAMKLKTAGCDIDLSGNDWMKEGNFGEEESEGDAKGNTSKLPKGTKAENAKTRIVGQVNDLHSRLADAIKNNDPILEHDYRVEYAVLLRSAYKVWMQDNTIRNELSLLMAEAEHFNVGRFKSDKLGIVKWVLNAVGKMSKILNA